MTENKQHLRFSILRRIEHWVNFLSFATLAITGLPQKYPQAGISKIIIQIFGGLELTRLIHRGSAIALILIGVWHFGMMIYKWVVARAPLTMGFSKDDAINAWKTIRYNLKLSDEKPHQGFYTFEEKVEYYALIWGTLVMIATGFFLWNPLTTAKFLPAAWIPAAKAAHSGEALLAVLAVILWHFYHVFVKHFNKSMYTGYMSEHEMEEFHPAALDEDYTPPAKNDPAYRRRKMLFLSIYGVFAVFMFIGLFWFVTTEETAVANPEPVPDLVGINNYSPLEPTPMATLRAPNSEDIEIGTTWSTGVGDLIIEKCGLCHNEIGNPGNFQTRSYEDLMAGGDHGPAVVPGQPGISLITIWPQRGDHPESVTLEELHAIRVWITNGATDD